MAIKIIDNKTEMVTFGSLVVGDVFKWQNHLCIKTESSFSFDQLNEYFDNFYAIEEIEDLENEGFLPYNCWSISNNCLMRFDLSSKVEKIDAELHIV